MGNLLSGTSFKEPTTVEDCDSTWQTDSEPEPDEEEDGPAGSGPGSREGPGHEPEQPAGPPARASPRAEDNPAAPEGDADAAGSKEQNDDSTESAAKPKRSFYAARDLYKYRHQYPQNFKDLRYQNDLSNLRFYKNKIPFKPDGVYIEEVLNKWKGDYEKLEHNHTYIQWLFPLREQGLNFYAKELTTYEIEEFKKTKEATRRFFLAYKMMLEFFGMKLTDKTGNVVRATNWQERFQHLNESQHNYLRITRILKSLGELGYEHFKSPLVKFILQEALVENTLPNIKQSALEYFVYTIRDRRERRKLLRYAQQHYTPPDHFIWGPAKKQKPEGSKAAKTPTSPVSGHNSQSSMHKKSKESKNNPTAVHLSSKAAEENKAELKENEENADRPGMEAGNEIAKRRNSEKDSSAESPNSKPEKTINNLLDKKENAASLEKGEDSECQRLDCENSGVKRKVSSDEDSKNCSSNCSENPQTSLGREKTIVEPIPKNKDEVRS
ncbi:opioid growth factor receptor-like protein 1 isoform X1 [Phascolarctos cinereus]|uniref:Opioid growth factor receptor-like protein 1 isoform X1 n=1 Tax=Phascolarctos cinereus TaxID=38626 RepID=A0A6P5LCY0_PHACI|nr:opioid growth factor receptor-like protein 1 isoform X1 [Phascolarctos cinereus]